MFIKWRGGNKMAYQENRNNLEGVEEWIIPTGEVKQKLDGVVDSVPPDKGLKCLMES